jgi:tRNA U34 5-methylaminomethyl-2-thiouridine-forming methyltransferase MnmC
MQDETDHVSFMPEGTPVSARFGDPYFSREGGLAESRHVFLEGNMLPVRLADGFRVAELGFGTGLNLIALALAFSGPGRVRFTSFELCPMHADDMARALAVFPEAAGLAPGLVAARRQGATRFLLGGVDVRLVAGDARETLPRWGGRADAWFLDGFAPAKNPEMWGEALMREVADHTAPGGTFATYSAAGHVRRALQAAGFQVSRVPGHGRKRHMSRGVLAARE